MKAKKILLAICLLLWNGCQPGNKSTPDDLIGVWKTTDSRYAGRSFELTKDHIIFGTGENSASFHPIAEIQKLPQAGANLYTIIYVNQEGQKYKFSFFYNSDSGGVIWFKNQNDIRWRKMRR